MSAKIIAIEGLDAVGKNTQSNLLKEKLIELGYKADVWSWPNYDSESCNYVKRYLDGLYPENTPRKAVCMLYAMDRFNTFSLDKKFIQMMEENDFVIFDRYVASNIICQCGLLGLEFKSTYTHIPDIDPGYDERLAEVLRSAKYELARWIYTTEHEDLGIPQPDMTVYLDLKPQTAYGLLQYRAHEKNRKIDIHETFEKQSAFYESFPYVNRVYRDVHVVDCNVYRSGSGITSLNIDAYTKLIRSKEDISNDILSIVKKYLIKKN